jgi:hypothetical protein
MSISRRSHALAALVPMAALAVSFVAAPAAQAATIKPLTVRPATVWVNCSTVTEGESGGQYYLEVSCSPVQASSWEFAMECSNDVVYTSGFYTTFENVSLYCPAGYTPIADGVYYNP